jgi:hypothetical protein
MIEFYFYHQGEVKFFEFWPGISDGKLSGAYVLDTRMPVNPWGRVHAHQGTRKNIPKEEVPKEFLAMLLLMGVTIP